MSELTVLVESARALRRARTPFLLATVVRIRGSSYRRPGARMIVTHDGPVAGSISGGCLERDVAQRGFWRTRDRDAVVVSYDATVDEDLRSGFGLGCDGVVDVLLERAREDDACDPFEVLGRCVDEERAVAMATVFGSQRTRVHVGARVAVDDAGKLDSTLRDAHAHAALATAAQRALAGSATGTWSSDDGDMDALVEAVAPAPHLFVFGSGPDAAPVVAAAKAVGWTVTVCDRQARFVTCERFAAADRRIVFGRSDVGASVDACARPLAVVLSHDYENDRDVIRELTRTRALYIGLLGPRRRTDRMLAEIERDGGPSADTVRARISAPVGLDIGAETPAEVALAIVAEAQAALSGRAGGRLRDRAGAIHFSPFLAGR